MLTPEEKIIEKRFKKDGFTVTKIDEHCKYKAPDFKLAKINFVSLAEVKVGFKKGKTLEILKETGASRFDPIPAIEDYFREVNLKYLEYIKHNPRDNVHPYIVIFTTPFFINNQLEWSDTPYKKYKNISAVFIPKQKHPLDKEADKMS